MQFIANLGLIRILVMVFLGIGSFSETWKGICRPVLVLIGIIYIPGMLTAYITDKATHGKEGMLSELISILVSVGVMAVVALIIFYTLKE